MFQTGKKFKHLPIRREAPKVPLERQLGYGPPSKQQDSLIF